MKSTDLHSRGSTHPQTIRSHVLLGGLAEERILVQPVGNVAVEGAWFHGHAVHAGERPVCDVESFQHPEA